MSRVSAVTFLLGTAIVLSGILVEAVGGGPVGLLSPHHTAGVRGGDIGDPEEAYQCYTQAVLSCDGAPEANSCSSGCEEEAGCWICVPHDGPGGPNTGPAPEGFTWNSAQGAEALPLNTPGNDQVALGLSLNYASCWSCECVDVDGGKTCSDEDPFDPVPCYGTMSVDQTSILSCP